MISYVTGNLLESPAQVLVNTVNTVGVMGKGIAKEFKRIYPDMFKIYRDRCEKGLIDIGKLWLYKTTNKWILNFPSKKHWRFPSKPDYIEAGLNNFVEIYSKYGIHSIAFPPLGCGNGELDFEDQVKPIMEKYLRNLPIYAFIYPGLEEVQIPEHKNQREIKEWLKSDPESLSFTEVWEDLEDILKRNGTFRTFANQNIFSATLDEVHKSRIKIKAKSRDFYLYKDELLDVWKQLRAYGFSTRHIVPHGLDRKISYILPIFSKLEYLKLVDISDDYENLTKNPTKAIQYLGVPKTKNAQYNLFSSI